jgi:glycosyltransferase involved in cell wall biosynthesis
MNNMKIVWICHFSNPEIRNNLNLSKYKVQNLIRSLLGKKKKRYLDFAPWINNLIKEFENIQDIELHIIAPHSGLIDELSEFELNGIEYHFYKYEKLFPVNILERKKNGNAHFTKNRSSVKKLISKIKPDLVNLIGTENPYYSITALDIEEIPVLVTVQTVYTNPNRKAMTGELDPFRWDIELQIHQNEKYFACGGRMHYDIIKNNNPNAIVFKNFFPIEFPSKVKNVPKEYDFVFFAAGVTPKKGIEDALEAFAQVKEKKSNSTLNIVGKIATDYKGFLMDKATAFGIQSNISFNDYFPIHADMHQHIKKGRIALLPIKLDIIPGTVIEAMLLEIPVITYRTTGTPYLNKGGETVLICDIGDINQLARNMLSLLDDSERANKMANMAKEFAEIEFNNTSSAIRLVADYKAVFNHYHDNVPIPIALLFNEVEFPVY